MCGAGVERKIDRSIDEWMWTRAIPKENSSSSLAYEREKK